VNGTVTLSIPVPRHPAMASNAHTARAIGQAYPFFIVSLSRNRRHTLHGADPLFV